MSKIKSFPTIRTIKNTGKLIFTEDGVHSRQISISEVGDAVKEALKDIPGNFLDDETEEQVYGDTEYWMGATDGSYNTADNFKAFMPRIFFPHLDSKYDGPNISPMILERYKNNRQRINRGIRSGNLLDYINIHNLYGFSKTVFETFTEAIPPFDYSQKRDCSSVDTIKGAHPFLYDLILKDTEHFTHRDTIDFICDLPMFIAPIFYRNHPNPSYHYADGSGGIDFIMLVVFPNQYWDIPGFDEIVRHYDFSKIKVNYPNISDMDWSIGALPLPSINLLLKIENDRLDKVKEYFPNYYKFFDPDPEHHIVGHLYGNLSWPYAGDWPPAWLSEYDRTIASCSSTILSIDEQEDVMYKALLDIFSEHTLFNTMIEGWNNFENHWQMRRRTNPDTGETEIYYVEFAEPNPIEAELKSDVNSEIDGLYIVPDSPTIYSNEYTAFGANGFKNSNGEGGDTHIKLTQRSIQCDTPYPIDRYYRDDEGYLHATEPIVYEGSDVLKWDGDAYCKYLYNYIFGNINGISSFIFGPNDVARTNMDRGCKIVNLKFGEGLSTHYTANTGMVLKVDNGYLANYPAYTFVNGGIDPVTGYLEADGQVAMVKQNGVPVVGGTIAAIDFSGTTRINTLLMSGSSTGFGNTAAEELPSVYVEDEDHNYHCYKRFKMNVTKQNLTGSNSNRDTLASSGTISFGPTQYGPYPAGNSGTVYSYDKMIIIFRVLIESPEDGTFTLFVIDPTQGNPDMYKNMLNPNSQSYDPTYTDFDTIEVKAGEQTTLEVVKVVDADPNATRSSYTSKTYYGFIDHSLDTQTFIDHSSSWTISPRYYQMVTVKYLINV